MTLPLTLTLDDRRPDQRYLEVHDGRGQRYAYATWARGHRGAYWEVWRRGAGASDWSSEYAGNAEAALHLLRTWFPTAVLS